ncbi:MAG: haloacid dehalogenase type II [Vulcanimicrobiaceae bacterium]
MNAPLAYVFDLYGTLVDYSSLRDRFAGRVADADAFVAAWRQKQLAYTFAATLMDRYVDFDTMTARAFDYTAATYEFAPGSAARSEAIAAWSHLPAYGDVAPTLRALRARGARTAVLSNGTPNALRTTLETAELSTLFDAVLSVDAVRKYKPHPDVYRLATQRFETSPERIAFVSSNGWDATGAAEFGFRVVWCNRSGAPPETFGAPPARTIATLANVLDS